MKDQTPNSSKEELNARPTIAKSISGLKAFVESLEIALKHLIQISDFMIRFRDNITEADVDKLSLELMLGALKGMQKVIFGMSQTISVCRKLVSKKLEFHRRQNPTDIVKIEPKPGKKLSFKGKLYSGEGEYLTLVKDKPVSEETLEGLDLV